MVVHTLATKDAYASALKDNNVVVVDCFATWCGPCKMIAPLVEKFSTTYPGAHFAKFDVDEIPDLAKELEVRSLPTFIVFKDGAKVSSINGTNARALEAAVKEAVGE